MKELSEITERARARHGIYGDYYERHSENPYKTGFKYS